MYIKKDEYIIYIYISLSLSVCLSVCLSVSLSLSLPVGLNPKPILAAIGPNEEHLWKTWCSWDFEYFRFCL